MLVIRSFVKNRELLRRIEEVKSFSNILTDKQIVARLNNTNTVSFYPQQLRTTFEIVRRSFQENDKVAIRYQESIKKLGLISNQGIQDALARVRKITTAQPPFRNSTVSSFHKNKNL